MKQKPASLLGRIDRNSRTVGGLSTIGPTQPLNEIREALGLTQAEVAQALGIRRTAIANVESGRYAMSFLKGIEMYLFFAKIAAEKGLTPLYLEVKRDVARFIRWQRKLNAEALKEIEDKAEKERKRRANFEKQLAQEEARLAEI